MFQVMIVCSQREKMLYTYHADWIQSQMFLVNFWTDFGG